MSGRMLRDLMNPPTVGAAKALDAISRFGVAFTGFRTETEVMTALCASLTTAGYVRAAVGRLAGNDPLHVLPIVELPPREPHEVIDLSEGAVSTTPALGGGSPHVVDTTIVQRAGQGAATDCATTLSVVVAVSGVPWGALVVGSNDRDAFGSHERAAVEHAAVHLSVALEVIGQRTAITSSESRFRQLVENIDEIIYAATADGQLTYVSPAVERVLGVAPSAILGRNYAERFTPGDLDVTVEGFDRQRRGVVPFVRVRVRDAQGRMRILRASLFPVSAETPGFVGMASDITAQVLAEEQLLAAFEGTIRTLGAVTVARDPYTAEHQQRVSQLASAVAEEMELPSETVRVIRHAGLVHDIGKMSIPAEILNKPSALTDPERSLIEAHPMVAHRILREIDFPWPIADIVLQHHERVDGSGYPHGLRGSEILLEARILAVADVVEAMSSHRPYRPARGLGAARDDIASHAGTLYDPDAVAACLRVLAQDRSPFDAPV